MEGDAPSGWNSWAKLLNGEARVAAVGAGPGTTTMATPAGSAALSVPTAGAIVTSGSTASPVSDASSATAPEKGLRERKDPLHA